MELLGVVLLLVAAMLLEGWLYSRYGLRHLQYRCYFQQKEVPEGSVLELVEELENQKFLQHTSKIRGFFAKQKYMATQHKTHHIYKCPNCKQKIRVPKGKGKIEIRCPKCQTTFIKKS